jgi:hypothetical protein
MKCRIEQSRIAQYHMAQMLWLRTSSIANKATCATYTQPLDAKKKHEVRRRQQQWVLMAQAAAPLKPGLPNI